MLLFVSAVACGGGGADATPGASTPANAVVATGGSVDPNKPALPDHPESDKVTWKKDAAAKSCHVGSKGGDLVAGATAMANACVDTQKMHQLGQPSTGQGQYATATSVTTLPLKAQTNRCYRIIGLAEGTVTDLDIAVTDSNGKSAGEDVTDSNDAIVLENGSLCFKQDDSANINVAVAGGSGKWAVEIWSD